MEFRRILIMKSSSMGDIVHALPTLAVLRARYPQASISWFVKQQWAELLDRVEGLDRIWAVGPGFRAWLSQISGLRRAQFDLVVDLQGLFRSGVMAWLTNCPTRIGFAHGREGSPLFYTHRVSVPTPDMHAVDRYLHLVSSLGVPIQGEPNFMIKGSERDHENLKDLFTQKKLLPHSSWVAMCISARWPTKQWPPEFFAKTADRIQEEMGIPVALIGGLEDKAIGSLVMNTMKTNPVNLVGETSLGMLPALMESASLLLTNDSGPMHIAAAVRTPVVALFGPTSPVRTGPYGRGHNVVTHNVPCSPCFSRKCKNRVDLECLKTIAPDQVFEIVKNRFSTL